MNGTATAAPVCRVFGVTHHNNRCGCPELLNRLQPRDRPDTSDTDGRLSGAEAARILGVNPQTFHRWVTIHGRKLGVEDPNPGTGHPRTVPAATLPAWQAAVDLVRFGLPPSTVFALSAERRARLRDAMADVLHDGERQ